MAGNCLALFLLFFVSPGCRTTKTNPALLGKHSLKELARTDDCLWLSTRTGAEPDSAVMSRLKQIDWKNKSWKVYMGCWCSDTKQLLPAFERIKKELAVNDRQVSYYALDMGKSSPGGSEKADGVEFVPTFILYENGKEIGRIVETATPDMESAILALF